MHGAQAQLRVATNSDRLGGHGVLMDVQSAREFYAAVVILLVATGLAWLRLASYRWYGGRTRWPATKIAQRARHVMRLGLLLAAFGLVAAAASHASGVAAGRWPGFVLAGIGWLCVLGALVVAAREMVTECRRSKS